MASKKKHPDYKALLRWAIRFVESETNCLEECHMNPSTEIVEPESVRKQIQVARRWIKKAREVAV